MRGKESKLTVRIEPNKAEISSDDIFQWVFYRTRTTGTKSKDSKNYPHIAKELVILAAKKPHLHDSRHEELAKKYDCSQHEFHFILGKLRMAGFLRKQGHIYYADRRFARVLRQAAMTMMLFCDDLGIPIEREG